MTGRDLNLRTGDLCVHQRRVLYYLTLLQDFWTGEFYNDDFLILEVLSITHKPVPVLRILLGGDTPRVVEVLAWEAEKMASYGRLLVLRCEREDIRTQRSVGGQP